MQCALSGCQIEPSADAVYLSIWMMTQMNILDRRQWAVQLRRAAGIGKVCKWHRKEIVQVNKISFCWTKIKESERLWRGEAHFKVQSIGLAFAGSLFELVRTSNSAVPSIRSFVVLSWKCPIDLDMLSGHAAWRDRTRHQTVGAFLNEWIKLNKYTWQNQTGYQVSWDNALTQTDGSSALNTLGSFSLSKLDF